MFYYDIAAFFKNMSEYTNTMSVLALLYYAPALFSSFAGRRPAHHASLRSPILPVGRGFTCHSRSKQKRPPEGDLFCFMVEAAGVEPASASTLPLALHA